MGLCRYCKQSAGFFRDEHFNCLETAEVARQELRSLMRKLVRGEVAGKDFWVKFDGLARDGQLPSKETESIPYEWLDGLVGEYAFDQPLSGINLDRICELYAQLYVGWGNLDAEQKAQLPGFLTALHSGTLYDVLHDTVPSKRYPNMTSGFRLDAEESPVVRRNTILAEHYSAPAGSVFQSVSIPIGKGVYYRIGTSQKHSEQSKLRQLDQGLMLLTTKAIYFSGNSMTFRLDYGSIMRALPHNNGFEVSGSFGSRRVFLPARIGTINESWYFYNIVAALAHIA